MPHPKIENHTEFVLAPMFVSNADGRPILAPIVKATFGLSKPLEPAKEQLPITYEGIGNIGDVGIGSYKYEPETAFIKPTTDVALIGHAYPAHSGDTQVDVKLRVGDTLAKTVRVFGDRKWVKRMGVVDMTDPQPLEKIPLIYERAFGGWNAAEPDPATSQFEARNPVGCGFKRIEWEDGLPVPNVEDPKRLIKYYGDTAPPAGFGFTSPNWQPRASYAGTYDQEWEIERAPLLPKDFDVRFFNAASPGLISNDYLKGNETVFIENASPKGAVSFELPGISPPRIRIRFRGLPDEFLETNLDTVIINTDENLLIMLWRNSLVLRNGPSDVIAIEVS